MPCGKERRRRRVLVLVFVMAAFALSACKTVEGGPDRLYSVAEEVALARGLLDSARDGAGGLTARYYAAADDAQRVFLRNEIIARRMYVIDIAYSEYEESLTSERQKLGFLTTTAATGLGIASTLVTPIKSAQILAGTGAAVLGARAAYDSEVVIAKTIQIAQGQMRAMRDAKAIVIQSKRNLSPIAYPLSAALHDLEDYYRAGTLTAGLIKAVGEAGAAAEVASISKDAVYSGTYARDDSSDILQNYISPNGKINTARVSALNGLLLEMGYRVDVRTIVDLAEAAPIRSLLIPYALGKGVDLKR